MHFRLVDSRVPTFEENVRITLWHTALSKHAIFSVVLAVLGFCKDPVVSSLDLALSYKALFSPAPKWQVCCVVFLVRPGLASLLFFPLVHRIARTLVFTEAVPRP